MPVTYTIDAARKTIRTCCVGSVTLEEVVNHFRTLAQDSACPERLDVFLDLSAAEGLPETVEVTIIASEIKRLRDRVRFDACAILVSNDALFGVMRIFEVRAEEYFRVTRVFREARDAEAWLLAQQSADNDKSK